MITFKQIAQFVDKNKAVLDDESLFLIIHGNDFTFMRNDFSYLNIEGAYDFFINGDIAFTGMKHGDIATTWSMDPGTFKEKNGGEDNLHRVTYNMSFDYRTTFMTLGGYKKHTEARKYNNDAGMVNVGFEVDGSAYWTIDTIKLIETPSLFYKDSYGHQKDLNYKFNCIGLVLGTQLEQKVKPYISKNESVIFKYNEFINKKAE